MVGRLEVALVRVFEVLAIYGATRTKRRWEPSKENPQAFGRIRAIEAWATFANHVVMLGREGVGGHLIFFSAPAGV